MSPAKRACKPVPLDHGSAQSLMFWAAAQARSELYARAQMAVLR